MCICWFFILVLNHHCLIMDYLKNGAYMFINFCYKNSATNNIPRRALPCDVTYGE
jgi:hypothetical protein